MIFFMGRKEADIIYPPVVNKCPDYWDYDESGNKCENTFGMKDASGSKAPSLDLDKYTEGTVGKCDKRNDVVNLGLTWDGITNNEKLDCSEY